MSEKFIIHDFQNEEYWLQGRMDGIGGSDAACIVGKSPYKSNIQLWEEKTGRRSPEDISDKPCVVFGKCAEDPIREIFKYDFPEYKVSHHDFRILQSKEYPFMQASLDGELVDQQGRRGILEIKTTNIMSSAQFSNWDEQIPENYYCQVLHYLIVTGWDFVVLKARLKMDWGGEIRATVKHYKIERTEVEDDLAMLLEVEKKFWKCVENDTAPHAVIDM